LGAAWYLPEERQITTVQALQDEMCAILGGRAAEELFLGHISTGAANDLERVTKMAYAMVAYYGMGKNKELKNLSYYDSSSQGYGFTKPYSDERAKLIDREVSSLIDTEYERAKEILTKYAEGHAKLTEVLLEREVIYTEDVQRIFGVRPWVSRTEEILELNAEEVPAEVEESKAEETAEPEDTNTEIKE
ncbi:MAG: cell division protein FtsH, partial [Bacteroidales bacterium]